MVKSLQLQVTVEHGHALARVAADLAAQGFQVGQVLEAIDVIVGSAPASALARLRRVKGVVDVAEQPQIDVGPPGGEGGPTW